MTKRKGNTHASPWIASLDIKGKKISRSFKSEEEAATGRDDLVREYKDQIGPNWRKRLIFPTSEEMLWLIKNVPPPLLICFAETKKVSQNNIT